MASWRRLLRQRAEWDEAFASDKTGNSKLARIAMMAMTTSSSMRVKPRSNPELESRSDLVTVAVVFKPRTAGGMGNSSRSDDRNAVARSCVAPRRGTLGTLNRRVNPTATITGSLRDDRDGGNPIEVGFAL